MNQQRRRGTARRRVLGWAAAGLLCVLGAVSLRSTQAPPVPQGVASPELLLDQAKRAFAATQWEVARSLLDQIVVALTASTPPQKPDLLVEAYEWRARTRYNSGNNPGAEQDFASLLAIKPSHRMSSDLSARHIALFETVRKVTVGQISASLTPAGEVLIDGKPFALQDTPQPIDLLVGEHELTVTRQGYREIAQKFTVTAATTTPLALALERISSTLAITTIPSGVEVLFNGTAKGVTQKGDGPSDVSAPLILTDLPSGTHRLTLRRECHREVERTVAIDQPGDLRTDPIELTQTVATVRIETAVTGAMIVIDGAPRGEAPAEITNICEGPHVIEVRGPAGRFIDRRDWKTGDRVTLTPELRSAFAIVSTKTGPGITAEQARLNVERALGVAKNLLVFTPVDVELQAAIRGESIPAGWLSSGPAASPPAPRELTRDLSRKLSQRLQAQGLAGVTVGADPYTVSVALLVPGSTEPDVITINLSDAGSRDRAIDAIGARLPPLLRASLETSVVDVAGVPGAVVVRPGGSGAKAGLVAGDVIVSAAGTPTGSVADLRNAIAALRPPATGAALDVQSPAGGTRSVTGAVTIVPDTIPLRDPARLYNLALLEVRAALDTATTPVAKAAAHLNLGIVHMRLGNWDEAVAELKAAQLPEGPGVSAGTVAYLLGLSYEATANPIEAQAAFAKAAASPAARLWNEGPLVAPLARQKLQPRR